MEAALGRGQRRFVLDNTWPTVESSSTSRNPTVETVVIVW